MKATAWLGIVLIVLGVVALLYEGIPYRKEESVRLGPLEAQVETEEKFSIPPIVGGLLLAAGTVLVFTGMRKPPGK